MKSKGTHTNVPTVKDWGRVLKSLSDHNKAINKQFPKALEQYPELIAGLVATVGYLTSGIQNLRWQATTGKTIDLDWMPDPLDPKPCDFLPDPLCNCLFGFPDGRRDCNELRDYFEGILVEGLPKWPPPATCDDLLQARDDAYACYGQVDTTLPLDEYFEALDACDVAVDDADEAIVAAGCECDLLRQQLEVAIACYANPPPGTDPEVCSQEVDRIRGEMEANGCN